MKKQPEFATLSLSDEQLICKVPQLLEELADGMDLGGDEGSSNASELAIRHGGKRRVQGYTVPMMLDEMRILQTTMLGVVQSKLLEVDLNFLVPDLAVVIDRLSTLLQQSIQVLIPHAARRSA
jgi:hypothetical protein